MRHLLICVICCLLLSACSREEDQPAAESAIDRATKKTADAAVQKIKTPLDKAEAVKELEEQRREHQQKQVQ